MSSVNKPITPASIPDDLVPMGFIAGAFGIKGWVKVVSSTEYADNLFDYPTWWLGKDGQWRTIELAEGNVQPKNLVAKLVGIEDRDQAFALKGWTIAIPRSQMPAAEEGEYYWADLIGMEVVNLQGESLGSVKNLLETGANDVLVAFDGKTERLLPFVANVVIEVDQANRLIKVDWGLDY